jgi:hypothetical protein
VEMRKEIDGELMIKSTKRHLVNLKAEDKEGDGPPTFWRKLYGPVIHTDSIILSEEEEEEGGRVKVTGESSANIQVEMEVRPKEGN